MCTFFVITLLLITVFVIVMSNEGGSMAHWFHHSSTASANRMSSQVRQHHEMSAGVQIDEEELKNDQVGEISLDDGEDKTDERIAEENLGLSMAINKMMNITKMAGSQSQSQSKISKSPSESQSPFEPQSQPRSQPQPQLQSQPQSLGEALMGRRRRSFSYKSICIPEITKKCIMVTFGGVTKPFCVNVKQNICHALD